MGTGGDKELVRWGYVVKWWESGETGSSGASPSYQSGHGDVNGVAECGNPKRLISSKRPKGTLQQSVALPWSPWYGRMGSSRLPPSWRGISASWSLNWGCGARAGPMGRSSMHDVCYSSWPPLSFHCTSRDALRPDRWAVLRISCVNN